MAAIAEGMRVAKKKGEKAPKRYGTLIRVSDAFAKALRDATRMEGVSAAEFADTHLLPIVQKRYRDAVLKRAKALESEGQS
jgi:hypothetical protein